MLARRRAQTQRLAVTVLALVLTVGAGTGPAVAEEDPPFVGWSTALPPLAGSYEPTSSDDCVAGRVQCVEKVIREMEKRFGPQAEGCPHSAVFALAYLRTTEEYLQTTLSPGFYDDPSFVNHEDAAFAAMYFDAYDAWTTGRPERVPPAWRVAFQAADGRQVTGSGDLLLGMNAHVNRDLPFLLAAIGQTAPDGTSRKPDHDQINVMLNSVVEPLMAEEAARFDPDMARTRTPYGVGYTALMQMLVEWRESAWRQAELLVAAPDDEARAQIAASIEADAALKAQEIVAATSYVAPLTSSDARDAYCAERVGTGE